MKAKFVWWGVLAALLLGAATSPLRAEYAHIQLRVDGMACPFCAYGIEKKLKGMELFESIQVDLEGGFVDLSVREGKVPDLLQIQEVIRQAGFTPREAEILAIGTLAIQDNVVFFSVRGTDQRIVLETQDIDGGMVGKEVPPYQEAWAEEGTLIAATGTFHLHKGENPPGLRASALEEIHTLIVAVQGMDCSGCGDRIAKALEDVEGIYRVRQDLREMEAMPGYGHLFIESFGRVLPSEPVMAALREAGFQGMAM